MEDVGSTLGRIFLVLDDVLLVSVAVEQLVCGADLDRLEIGFLEHDDESLLLLLGSERIRATAGAHLHAQIVLQG